MLITVILIVGPVTVGAGLGYLLGRAWMGVLSALVTGSVLTAGGLLLWYLDAPTDDPTGSECYECGEYWGRLMDQTMFTVWLPMTLILWTIGVGIGASRRRRSWRF